MRLRPVMMQSAALVTVVYTVLGAVWILFSDRLLEIFVGDPRWLSRLQTVKGWLFVAATAVLLYCAMRAAARGRASGSESPTADHDAGSLRRRILLVILLATLPVFGLTLYYGLEQRQRQRADAHTDLLRCSRMVAARQERIWDSVRVLLTTLQEVPAVQLRDATASGELFHGLLQRKPRWETLALLTDSGQVVIQAGRPRWGHSAGGEPWFLTLLQSRQAVETILEPVNPGEPFALLCAQPVLSPQGQLLAVLAATVSFHWLDQMLQELELPQGAVLAAMTREGRLLGYSAGLPAAPGQWRGRVGEGMPNLSEQTYWDGVARLQVATPARVGGTEIWLAVGLPARLATLESNLVLIRVLLTELLILAAMVVVAWALAEVSIVRYTRSLTAVARRLSEGDLTARVGLSPGPKEFQELATAFDELAKSLQRRTLERDHVEQVLRDSEAKYRRIVETAEEGIWLLDEQYQVQFANRKLAEMLGCRVEEMIGASVTRFLDEAHRRRTLSELGAPVPGRFECKLRRGDGGELWTLMSVAPLAMGRLVMVTDITPLKRAEETLRALVRRLRAIREEETTRIAREIHDELGQAITALKLDVGWLARRLREPPVAEKLQAMTEQLDAMLQTVRRIAAELRPGVLDSLGLVAAIEWQAQEFTKRTGVVCRVEAPEVQPRLDPARATALFRILQESLTNVARHARATRVDIRLTQANGDLVLRVSDNGVGLPSLLNTSQSLGLLGMQERAVAVGGTVTVSRGEAVGTVVTATVPLDLSQQQEVFPL